MEDLQSLVDEGLSTRQIAKRLNKSQTAVQYQLNRAGIKTKYQKPELKWKDVGGSIIDTCAKHGETIFVREDRDKQKIRYRCKQCRIDIVYFGRKKLKEELIEIAGGSCVACGYRKLSRALTFHHRDPKDKKYSISLLISRRARDLAIEEIKKCDLYCMRCHAEKEEEIYMDEWRNGSAPA